MAYAIDPDLCDGCRLCIENCAVEAIAEDQDGVVRIDPGQCTDCGTCLDVCPKGAVSGAPE